MSFCFYAIKACAYGLLLILLRVEWRYFVPDDKNPHTSEPVQPKLNRISGF
jgi:hypothetical protein